jgi:FkbM family methyltransferase
MRIWLADPMAATWYDQDWPEPPEFEILRGAGLRGGARVFNLGAHQGVVALMLASEVAPGEVIAVEALDHNVQVARRNVALNSARNVRVIQAAVGRRSGTAYFSQALNGRVVGETRRFGAKQVRAMSLAELADAFGMPDLVYLDVEGSELDVLAGGEPILRESRPSLFVEVHVGCGLEERGGSAGELVSLLESCRYTCAIAAEGTAYRPIRAAPDLSAQRHFLIALPR